MAVTISFEIRRPFGGYVFGTGSGTLVGKIGGQRLGDSPPAIYYTHVLTVDPGVDIRDGCTRLANTFYLAFALGDEVRYPGGVTPQVRFAVVYVEKSAAVKTVYLCRDAVDWVNGGPV